ncbi:MAG: flagellar assembly protein FliW [Candidatus Muiribacteriota bacterium]
MKLKTTRFGELEITEEEIFYFKNGIFGFEKFKKYILLKEEDSLFSWLQSTENEELAFVLIRPVDFYYNYFLDIDGQDVNDLQVDENSNTEIYCIVVIPEDTSNMTGNLQGPIVLNKDKKIGKQVVSLNPKHKLRHYIVEDLKYKNEMEEKEKKDNDGEGRD